MTTIWAEYATKIETLLQLDLASQEQAYELLVTLMEQIREAGQQQCFSSLFERVDFSNSQVGWMRRKSSTLGWSERRTFQSEITKRQWFWRWLDIYYELFPDKLQDVPTAITVDGLTKWRTYFNLSSCEEIHIRTVPSGGINFAGIEHSNLRKITVQEDVLQYLSHKVLLKGKGRLRVEESGWNPRDMIVFDEINNQRSLVICRLFDAWIPLEELILEKHPHLQVVDTQIYHGTGTTSIDASVHRPSWSSQTPYDFLDWNSCWIFLDGDSSKSIAERVVQVRIEKEYRFDRLGQDLLETLFGDRVFPNLSSIYINTGSKSTYYLLNADNSLLLNAEMLNRFPSLRMIHITGDFKVELAADVLEQNHPLEAVYQKDSLITYFAFDKTLEGTLSSQLVALSTEGEWVQQNIRFLRNLRAVNMTQLLGNVAFVRELTSVETILVEQDAQDLPQLAVLWDGFFVPEVLEDWKKKRSKYPKRLIEDYGVEESEGFDYPELPNRVHDFDTLMRANFIHPDEPLSERYYGFVEDSGAYADYTCSKEFILQFVSTVREGTLSSSFLGWLRRRSELQEHFQTAIRVGPYTFWLNHLDQPQLVSWSDVCVDHLNSVWGSSPEKPFCVDLLRTVVGYQTLSQEIIDWLMSREYEYYDSNNEEHYCGIQAIRYNTSLIPFDVIERMVLDVDLRHLRVEETSILTKVSRLKPLKTLHLVDLQLTELPDDLGELTELEELYLWGNELTTLPDSMSKMTKLWKINISKNQFTELPDVLLGLPNLQEICFRGYEPDIEALRLRNAQFANRLEAGEVVIWNGKPKTVAV